LKENKLESIIEFKPYFLVGLFIFHKIEKKHTKSWHEKIFPCTLVEYSGFQTLVLSLLENIKKIGL